MGVEMHLKFEHKSTSLIIILYTIIKIFSEDSIIVKCMQFALWCIHGDRERHGFIDIDRENNVEATKNSDRRNNLLKCRCPDMIQ